MGRLASAVLFFATLFAVAARAETAAPNETSDLVCRFLQDVESKPADACPAAIAALKADDGMLKAKVEAARHRRKAVVRAFESMKGGGPEVSKAQDSAVLVPSLNERSFEIWLGKGANASIASTLTQRDEELKKELEQSQDAEDRKRLVAAITSNETKIRQLGRIKDASQFSCFLGEECGRQAKDTGVVGGTAGQGGVAWTSKDYESANQAAKNEGRVPGGRIDRGVPNLAGIAGEVAGNTPLGPLADGTSQEGGGINSIATVALASTGALLLFGGLGGKQLKEKFPNIRRNMGIVAAVGGAVATVAIAAPRLALTITPVAANPAAQEESEELLTKGQSAAQRLGQSASNVGTQAEAQLERVGSAIASRSGPLLNAERAQIDVRKLTEYALNPANPRGGMDKSRVFRSALGYTRDNYQGLLEQIQRGVRSTPAVRGEVDVHGVRYTVDILVKGPVGQAIVRTGWIFSPGSDVPRLVTLYVKP